MSESDKGKKSLSDNALQAERVRNKWTQQELANLVGTTIVNVSRWERGVTLPNAYFRRQLCQVFKKDASALGILPAKQMTQSETLPLTEDIIPEPSEAELIPYSPLTMQSFFLRRKSTGILLTAFSVVVAILLIGSGMLIHAYFFSPPQQASPAITTVQTDPPQALDNGGIDSWGREGHVSRMEDSIAVGGYKGGTHALRITLFSENQGDLPFIFINPHNPPRTGQILSVALFVPANISPTIKAQLYAADSSSNWHHGSFPILTPGKWNHLEFLIPAFPGPIFEVGIQFLSHPYNVPVTVYIDAFQWG